MECNHPKSVKVTAKRAVPEILWCPDCGSINLRGVWHQPAYELQEVLKALGKDRVPETPEEWDTLYRELSDSLRPLPRPAKDELHQVSCPAPKVPTF